MNIILDVEDLISPDEPVMPLKKRNIANPLINEEREKTRVGMALPRACRKESTRNASSVDLSRAAFLYDCRIDYSQAWLTPRFRRFATVHIKEETDNMQQSTCQMEIKCEAQIKEESSCLDEECSMSKAVMLAGLYTNHKPLYSDSTGCGVSEAEKLADKIKEETLCSDGMECGMTGMRESAILAGVDTDRDVKNELVLGSEHVKEEPLSHSKEYEMSEAAMLSDLYAEHVVKDELVLGPEHPHRPDVSLVGLESTSGFCDVQPLPHYLGDHNYAKESSTAVESTSVFCDVQPLPHYLGDHNYAKEFSTALDDSKTY
ncbi:uncharacterized protein LOC134676795 [Cydia fagiglandana]|uniref:uncharacterized protein LOC134676795 n=1 Tax=Cydia fagiglandana TaxID=1458189 RepID=UPI002FEE2AB0